MKLKQVGQIAVLSVIGFVFCMGGGMLTGLLGAIAMYVSAGLAAFLVAPVFVIMNRRVQKRGATFAFWLIFGILYALMGFWIATPVCLVAGIVGEIIVGDSIHKLRVALGFSASMFIYAMHQILFILILGPTGIANFVKSISLEQAEQMAAMYTPGMMLACAGINVVTELLAGYFGVFINDKFFEQRHQDSKLS